MSKQNTIPILLIEDDDDDVRLTERAFKKSGIDNLLYVTHDGEEALEYLRSESDGRPCVILLDLNMPKMNGIELLKIIKDDEELKVIPVVVLTTSQEQQDKVESFKLSVAGYMLKSVDYKRFVDTIRAVNLYWTLSELPTNGE